MFLGTIVGGIAATWAFPGEASAAIDCPTGAHYLNEVRTTATHYGTGVNGTYGMFVYDHVPVTCSHDSTILTEDTNANYIEVGWDDSKAGIYVSRYGVNGGCHDSGTGAVSVGDGHPHPIRTWMKAKGTDWHCVVFPNVSLNVSGFDHFDLKNIGGSGSTTWRFVLNGDDNILGATVDMPFESGYSVTSGEQFSGDEDESASFRGLQFLNGSNQWGDWGGATCNTPNAHNPNDPYDSYIQTAYTWIQVRTDGHFC